MTRTLLLSALGGIAVLVAAPHRASRYIADAAGARTVGHPRRLLLDPAEVPADDGAAGAPSW
jgi:hypothetical protein